MNITTTDIEPMRTIITDLLIKAQDELTNLHNELLKLTYLHDDATNRVIGLKADLDALDNPTIQDDNEEDDNEEDDNEEDDNEEDDNDGSEDNDRDEYDNLEWK